MYHPPLTESVRGGLVHDEFFAGSENASVATTLVSSVLGASDAAGKRCAGAGASGAVLEEKGETKKNKGTEKKRRTIHNNKRCALGRASKLTRTTKTF